MRLDRLWCAAPLFLATMLPLCPVRLAAETAGHFPTSEDLRNTRAVGDPRVSPDGAQVLVTVTDSTVEGGKSHLWLAGKGKNPARQLTFSATGEGRGESGGRWMPDGSAILFLAKRGESTQIFRLPMDGGESVSYDLKVTPQPGAAEKAAKRDSKSEQKDEALPIDVEGFDVSPDGRWLAVVAKDPQTAAEKKKDSDKDDADFVDHDPHETRLYMLALDSSGVGQGELQRISVAPDVEGVAWARHSDRLAVVSEAPNNAGDLHPARSAWIVERAGDSWTTAALSKVPPTVEPGIIWASDDTRLVYLAQAQRDAPPGVSDLYLTDAKSGETRVLSHDFPGAPHQVVDSENDTAIVAVTLGMTATYAYFPLAGGKPVPVSFEYPAVSGLNTNAGQTAWVYLQSGTGAPPSLCLARTLASGCTALATPTVIPKEWRSVAAQLVTWKSGEFTIEGILYLPPEAEHGKVPLIVDVHGGPTGQYTQAYSTFAQFLVGHGWAVLQTNPRGSTGYGAAFAAANKNDLGGGDYQDIMAGVDTVMAKFPIDSNKMALTGYSYGGEMAGFVEGKTERFRAIVSGAPVIDQMSEYGTESSSWYDRWFYGYPWEHEQDAWRQSPLSGVGHAKTPFLLLQGKADTTDPAGQAEEMYRALRQAGVPVELVEYPRENHGPLARGVFGYPSREPWHGFDARKRLVDFIQKQFDAVKEH
jgi:dipeptidyl aminopeptidase/acylaminoacyl peptidase